MENNNKDIKEQQVTNNIKAANKDLERLEKDFPQYFGENEYFNFEKF